MSRVPRVPPIVVPGDGCPCAAALVRGPYAISPRTPPSDFNRVRPTGMHGDHLDQATGSRGALFGACARNHVDKRAVRVVQVDRAVRASESARPGIPTHTGMALRAVKQGPPRTSDAMPLRYAA